MPAGTAPQEYATAIETLEGELESRTIEVPLLPAVAAEVLSSTLDDKSNATRLADLIQQDQALATHLLRVVNSAAFRGSTEIIALQQAIARLGMDRIREVALTVSLKGTLFISGPYDDYLENTWNHGLRTGLWAKEVARFAKKNVEVAYLCGLLHNVGTALVLNRLARLDAAVPRDELTGVVREYGPRAGIILVEEWRLPSAVGQCIRYQDDFEHAENGQDTVAIVDAASAIATLHARDALDSQACLLHPALQFLNFYPDDAAALCERSDAIQDTIEAISGPRRSTRGSAANDAAESTR